MTITTQPLVDHRALANFADERVNLPKSEVERHRSQVQRLRDHLQRVIDQHETYVLIKTLHSGSVAKGTALRSISDMDVAAYLDSSSIAQEHESQIVRDLAEILRTAYGANKDSDDFEEQDHSVKVHFHGTDLDVDVVPVIYAGLPDDRGLLITKTGDRVETSIKLHLEFIRSRKTAHGRQYAQIVRFLKYWAREQKRSRGNQFRCKSFLLELVVAHLADNGLLLGDNVEALEKVFAWLVSGGLDGVVSFSDYYTAASLESSTAPIRVFDPVTPSNNVCKTYSVTDKSLLVEAANDALDAVTAARYGTTRGYAIECWQEVFGPTFRDYQ